VTSDINDAPGTGVTFCPVYAALRKTLRCHTKVCPFRELELHFTSSGASLGACTVARSPRGSSSLTCSVISLDPGKAINGNTNGTRSSSEDHEHRAFDSFVQYLFTYLFYFRLRMLNRNIPESLNEILFNRQTI